MIGRRINQGGFPVVGPQGPEGDTGPIGPRGATGIEGMDGADGRGIAAILRTAGTGAAGTIDTYTITYTDATTSTFQVYNGADGAGNVISVNGRTGTVTGLAELTDITGGTRAGSFTTLRASGNTTLGDSAADTVTIPGEVLIGSYTRHVSNMINAGYSDDSENKALRINYYGYNGGTTRFRNLYVHDGKTNTLLGIEGATGAVTIPGTLSLTGGTFGYGTGAGGTVTQATSKSTGVTLNKPSGKVTMFSALNAYEDVSFNVYNSFVAATDFVVAQALAVSMPSVAIDVSSSYSGYFVVRLRNTTGTPHSSAVVIKFMVFKGSTS